ncbi:MAG TPA: ribosome maturation factor RimP [bacterium]
MEKVLKIIEEVREMVIPILEEQKMELVDLHYRMEQNGWVLRLLVDKPGGVNVDDCALVSREVSAHLDVRNLIPGKYLLEVSSPGINRPLKSIEDFSRFIGSRISLQLAVPSDGRRNFTGKIAGVGTEEITVDVDGKNYSFKIDGIKKATLKVL